jgi:uncharacterized protein
MKPKMHFEVYKDSKGEWRWRLIARNGRVLADSGEGYKSKTKVMRILSRIMICMQEEHVPIEE